MSDQTPEKPRNYIAWLIHVSFQSIPFFSLNIIWFLMTILIVTAPPAAAGLFYATSELKQGNQAGWGVFFEGFKKYFWVSWLWALVVWVGFGLIGFNIWFYLQQASNSALIGATFFIALYFVWFLIHLYSLPLLLRQEKPHVFQAMRNSLVILTRRALPTLRLLAMLLGIGIVSVLVPVLPIFISISLMVYLIVYEVDRAIVQLMPAESQH